MQTTQQKPVQDVSVGQQQFANDIMLSLLMARITRTFLGTTVNDKEVPINLSKAMDAAIVSLSVFENHAMPRTKAAEQWMRKELAKDKLNDIAQIISLMARIGTEERPEIYEEFLNIVVDCLHAILYAQKQRKVLHFGKYRALFKMFADEVVADVNGVKGQVIFQNKTIYLRTAPVEVPQEIQK